MARAVEEEERVRAHQRAQGVTARHFHVVVAAKDFIDGLWVRKEKLRPLPVAEFDQPGVMALVVFQERERAGGQQVLAQWHANPLGRRATARKGGRWLGLPSDGGYRPRAFRGRGVAGIGRWEPGADGGQAWGEKFESGEEPCDVLVWAGSQPDA